MGRPGEETIVLVDADDTVVGRFEDPLRERGYSTLRAGTAVECLDIVESQEVEMVVSAMVLPDLSGIQLLRSIRIARPALPFVMVSQRTESVKNEAIAAGVSGIVDQGLGDAEAIDRIETAMRRGQPWIDSEAFERYRHLIRISPAPINVFDGSGDSIWCNDAVVELLGVSGREEVIGQSIFQFIHPSDHDLARSEMERIFSDNEPVGPTRMRLRRPDGAIREILVSTTVGRFLGSEIGQAIVVDVTDLENARAQLDRERRMIDSALNALEDVFFVIDPPHTLDRWNDRLLEIPGVEADAVEDRGLEAITTADTHSTLQSGIRETVSSGEAVVELALGTADARSVPFEVRLQRVELAEHVRIVGIARNVSGRKDRERQLQVLDTWLRHNIRNEMNIIRGIAENVISGESDDVMRAAERIVDRADTLVNSADWERELIELISEPPAPGRHDIDAILDAVLAACEQRFPHARIDRSGSADRSILAIPQLQDALTEVVVNAIEHSESAQPQVQVTVTGGERPTIRIADDGPKIPPVEREVVTMKRDIDQLHHGSGLGLVFADWIVRRSGGRIEFGDSNSGGNVVILSFPSAELQT